MLAVVYGFDLATWWWVLFLMALLFLWQFLAMVRMCRDLDDLPIWAFVALAVTMVLAACASIAFVVGMVMSAIRSFTG